MRLPISGPVIDVFTVNVVANLGSHQIAQLHRGAIDAVPSDMVVAELLELKVTILEGLESPKPVVGGIDFAAVLDGFGGEEVSASRGCIDRPV